MAVHQNKAMLALARHMESPTKSTFSFRFNEPTIELQGEVLMSTSCGNWNWKHAISANTIVECILDFVHIKSKAQIGKGTIE
jgi:hypothetical protein